MRFWRRASLSTDQLLRDRTARTAADPAAVEVAFRSLGAMPTSPSTVARTFRVALMFDQMPTTVADNGRGNPPGNGVGWTSMTERAAELGGTCTISDGVHGGLLVRALLPLHADAASEVLA